MNIYWWLLCLLLLLYTTSLFRPPHVYLHFLSKSFVQPLIFSFGSQYSLQTSLFILCISKVPNAPIILQVSSRVTSSFHSSTFSTRSAFFAGLRLTLAIARTSFLYVFQLHCQLAAEQASIGFQKTIWRKDCSTSKEIFISQIKSCELECFEEPRPGKKREILCASFAMPMYCQKHQHIDLFSLGIRRQESPC